MIQNIIGHQTIYMQIKQPQFNLFHDCGNQIWSLMCEFDNGQSKVGIFYILRLKNLTKIDDQIWLPLSMSRS